MIFIIKLMLGMLLFVEFIGIMILFFLSAVIAIGVVLGIIITIAGIIAFIISIIYTIIIAIIQFLQYIFKIIKNKIIKYWKGI